MNKKYFNVFFVLLLISSCKSEYEIVQPSIHLNGNRIDYGYELGTVPMVIKNLKIKKWLGLYNVKADLFFADSTTSVFAVSIYKLDEKNNIKSLKNKNIGNNSRIHFITPINLKNRAVLYTQGLIMKEIKIIKNPKK